MSVNQNILLYVDSGILSGVFEETCQMTDCGQWTEGLDGLSFGMGDGLSDGRSVQLEQ